MIRSLILMVVLAVTPAAANETIVSGLSDNRVDITANFIGSDILVYGAVKRDAPPPKDQPMHVIITAEGPPVPHTLRHKEKVAGIWINTTSVELISAPSFYAVVTTGPLDDILNSTDDLRHKISLDHVVQDVGMTSATDQPELFIDALERLRSRTGNFQISENRVQFLQETLFRADIKLPANLIEGNYRVRIFLTRDGRVVDHQERIVGVRKAGIERALYRLAYDQPLIYGLLSLALAVFAGWGASEAFRLFRK
jgi:uncharacterized protein (TIGR02186 family)